MRAIIFDLDGTLIDSISANRKISQIVAQDFKFQFSQEDFFEVNGMTALEGITTIITKHKLGFRAEDFIKRRAEIIDEIYTYISLYPETISTLESFKDIPLAIATSSPRDYLNKIIEKFDLGTFFRAKLSADDIKHPKPSPDIFLKAAQILGVRADECVVVEDSVQGVIAGNRAGMRVVCVLSTTPKESFVGEAQAWKFISSLSELKKILPQITT